MIIALDYDDTFTKDDLFWAKFVQSAKERGHSVTFVTFRYEDGENNNIRADAEMLQISIIFTNRKQKADCFKADIWIDDMPHLIPGESSMILSRR